jgi:hypothetical protein
VREPPFCAAWWSASMAVDGAPERTFCRVGEAARVLKIAGLVPGVLADRSIAGFLPVCLSAD